MLCSKGSSFEWPSRVVIPLLWGNTAKALQGGAPAWAGRLPGRRGHGRVHGKVAACDHVSAEDAALADPAKGRGSAERRRGACAAPGRAAGGQGPPARWGGVCGALRVTGRWGLAVAPQCFCPVRGPGRQTQVPAPRRGQRRPGLVWGPGTRGTLGSGVCPATVPKGSGGLQGGELGSAGEGQESQPRQPGGPKEVR